MILELICCQDKQMAGLSPHDPEAIQDNDVRASRPALFPLRISPTWQGLARASRDHDHRHRRREKNSTATYYIHNNGRAGQDDCSVLMVLIRNT